MTITARRALIDAQRTSEQRITDLFAALLARIVGLVQLATGTDGLVPLRDAERLLAEARAAVEGAFVRRVTVYGTSYTAELAHLDDLITQARAALEGATGREQAAALGRVRMLSERYALLTGSSVALASVQNGAGLTDFAAILVEQTRAVAAGAIAPHTAFMARAVSTVPELSAPLSLGVRVTPRLAAATQQYGSVLTWQDARGYTLSDRIWRTGIATRERIDDVLRDGITRGRSAVDIAKDLEQFLNPSRRGVLTKTPYGTSGSFDARRLARSEITRAHALAGHEAALANPFVRRARWHLSASHGAEKCDGTCDAIYARDQAEGGFALDATPLPVVSTHPSCLCYTTYETAPIAETLDDLRAQLAGAPARNAPLTALNTDALVNVVMTGLSPDTRTAAVNSR
jgi:hypothetical protein